MRGSSRSGSGKRRSYKPPGGTPRKSSPASSPVSRRQTPASAQPERTASATRAVIARASLAAAGGGRRVARRGTVARRSRPRDRLQRRSASALASAATEPEPCGAGLERDPLLPARDAEQDVARPGCFAGRRRVRVAVVLVLAGVGQVDPRDVDQAPAEEFQGRAARPPAAATRRTPAASAGQGRGEQADGRVAAGDDQRRLRVGTAGGGGPGRARDPVVRDQADRRRLDRVEPRPAADLGLPVPARRPQGLPGPRRPLGRGAGQREDVLDPAPERRRQPQRRRRRRHQPAGLDRADTRPRQTRPPRQVVLRPAQPQPVVAHPVHQAEAFTCHDRVRLRHDCRGVKERL